MDDRSSEMEETHVVHTSPAGEIRIEKKNPGQLTTTDRVMRLVRDSRVREIDRLSHEVETGKRLTLRMKMTEDGWEGEDDESALLWWYLIVQSRFRPIGGQWKAEEGPSASRSVVVWLVGT